MNCLDKVLVIFRDSFDETSHDNFFNDTTCPPLLLCIQAKGILVIGVARLPGIIKKLFGKEGGRSINLVRPMRQFMQNDPHPPFIGIE